MAITRRVLLQALTAGFFLPRFSAPRAAEAPLTFTLGALPAGRDIARVVSAGAPADLLLLAVAPEKLVGLSSFNFTRPQDSWLAESLRRLPKYGRLAGRASTLSLEQLMMLHPDLIVDCGNADETWLSEARRVTGRTQIPWLLIDGALHASPQQLLTLGEVLDCEARTRQQAELARRFIDDAHAFSRTPAANVRFYAARGPRGLETGLRGSLHTEAAELLGLRNVAEVPGRRGLANVSLENLLAWQPDIILVQDDVTRQSLLQDATWQGVKAVAEGRILLLHGLPFGWLDAPPGINRLLGLRRLQAWLDPAVRATFRQDMQRYAELFWHTPLSDAQYHRLTETT